MSKRDTNRAADTNNEGTETMTTSTELFDAADAAGLARDAANTELRRAWDIEDAVGPNDASDRATERLRIKAERADDAYAEAKAAAIAAWHAEGSPLPATS